MGPKVGVAGIEVRFLDGAQSWRGGDRCKNALLKGASWPSPEHLGGCGDSRGFPISPRASLRWSAGRFSLA